MYASFILACHLAPHLRNITSPASHTISCEVSGLNPVVSSHLLARFIAPHTACGTTRTQGVSAAILNPVLAAAVAGIIFVRVPVNHLAVDTAVGKYHFSSAFCAGAYDSVPVFSYQGTHFSAR